MAAAARRKCSKCGLNRAEKFFSSPNARVCDWCQRARRKTAARKQHLNDNYAITAEEDASLDAFQGGVCGICERNTTYELHVDHDHQIEKALIQQGYAPMQARRMSVRGKLCKTCNRRLLPAAHDNVETLQRAIQYLENWPSSGIIGREDWNG